LTLIDNRHITELFCEYRYSMILDIFQYLSNVSRKITKAQYCRNVTKPSLHISCDSLYRLTKKNNLNGYGCIRDSSAIPNALRGRRKTLVRIYLRALKKKQESNKRNIGYYRGATMQRPANGRRDASRLDNILSEVRQRRGNQSLTNSYTPKQDALNRFTGVKHQSFLSLLSSVRALTSICIYIFDRRVMLVWIGRDVTKYGPVIEPSPSENQSELVTTFRSGILMNYAKHREF
ncbi:hypothetical protein L9F63_002343, partial [Diploptera punctata]